ncbi:hypothetical protein N0V90_007220 [Kalmusia sp. IMI 367209]|nr:hypothetical protein N0V90_007220 [Kalmusia sp. IMI 367209]
MDQDTVKTQLAQAAGDGQTKFDKKFSVPFNKIVAVRLPKKPSNSLWDISIEEGRVSSIDPHEADQEHMQDSLGILQGAGRLLAPSLCHAHIHLDKCFLLQDPKYEDLQIESGDFQEAMELTGKAKARFAEDDLLRRGRQLVEESIQHGVTVMRAFVEVDGGVQFKCLDAGLQLKAEFTDRCEIQLCAFAQLPLFSGSDRGEEIRKLMNKAARVEGIDVLGSTPYVEEDESLQEKNVHWITSLAVARGKHLDLHLDYFLEEHRKPLIWTTLEIIKEENWAQNQGQQVTLGHCTRLTRFDTKQWTALRQRIDSLPVSFVGLPTSDLFMMRTPDNVRGTLPVVELIQRHSLNAAIAINNVGNAFTPQGSCDPLSIASLGVGIYQAGTKQGAEILYNEGAHGRPSQGIRALCVDLRDRIQQAFGEDSPEWTSIRRALDNFMKGHLSKKEAYSTMAQVLGDHDDLYQGLYDILYHKDARWGPRDWYQPTDTRAHPQVINPTSPEFLEPQHEPQFRLPSISQTLRSGAYAFQSQPSINPALLRSPSSQYTPDQVVLSQYQGFQGLPGHDTTGCEDHDRYDRRQAQPYQISPCSTNTSANWNPFMPIGQTSPASSMPVATSLPPYASPPLGQHPNLQSYNNLEYGAGSNPAGFTGERFHQTYHHGRHWQDVNTMSNWDNIGQEYQDGEDRSTAGHQRSHLAISPYQQTTQQLVPGQPSVHRTPMAVPLGQLTPEAVVFEQHDRNNTQANSSMVGQEIKLEFHLDELSNQGDTKLFTAPPTADSGPFIHALCGRGFSSRSSVRKHHWGPKIGDTSTTRGCWAKHKKPDQAWDEHPSCKPDASKTTGRKAKRTASEEDDSMPASSEFKAPQAPIMVPKPENIIPGFPTLDELPRTVAEAVQPIPGFSGTTTRHVNATMLSSALLTAANVASKVEAPKPHDGRNDSLVSHLDAHVAAAERTRQKLPTWMGSSGLGGTIIGNEFQYNVARAPTIGLGIIPEEPHRVPPNMVLASQSGEPSGMLAFAPTKYINNYAQGSRDGDDMKKSPTASSAQSSGSNEGYGKRRRISSRKSAASKQEQKQEQPEVSASPDKKRTKV